MNELDNNRYRQEMRMSRDAFLKLHELIKDHDIFVSDSRRPQTDVMIQMMVAFEQLGFYGNGASIGRIARSAGISGMTFICRLSSVSTRSNIYVYSITSFIYT